MNCADTGARGHHGPDGLSDYHVCLRHSLPVSHSLALSQYLPLPLPFPLPLPLPVFVTVYR